MENQKDCLFCQIVNGSIPSSKIYEDEHIIAFNDIHPAAPTHILFVPKKHYNSLAHVPAKDLGMMAQIFSAVQKVSVDRGLDKDGYRVSINTGKKGGQTVFHLHVHLLGGKSMSPQMG